MVERVGGLAHKPARANNSTSNQLSCRLTTLSITITTFITKETGHNSCLLVFEPRDLSLLTSLNFYADIFTL